MKLLKLSSNNPKFKTIQFKDGLNILAGLQLTSSEKKTYNGIGKSFSLNLIHLLLGSTLDKKKKKDSQILDFLASYGTFTLDFEHHGKPYKIVKNFSKTCYNINDKEINQSNYPSELRKIFLTHTFDSNISVKQLLNVFARRYGSTYYSEITTQQGMPINDYYQTYVNLSLLGVNTTLVREKAKVKDKLTQLDKAEKAVTGYEKALEKENVKDLKDKLAILIKSKAAFVIAENYNELKKDADNLTHEINNLRNNLHSIQNDLGRKLESIELTKSIDIDLDEVTNIYNEAKFFFDEKVSVRLKEAQEFHLNLMNSRVNRLHTEIAAFRQQQKELDQSLLLKGGKRDAILKDLNSKGALEEYNSINERTRTLESEIQELEKYKKILEGFKLNKSSLELENAKVNADGIRYLNDSKKYLESKENKFRALVKKFYENSGGSLEIQPTHNAKYLFNIDAHVPQDGSQGINEVKIFCYDFLLYQLNPELFSFIAHDGCIFSEMDPRQKSMIFKVALEHIHSGDLQYFVNIGQASLEEVLDKGNKINCLSKEEKKEIENSVILELYDKNPSSWLFGTRFG